MDDVKRHVEIIRHCGNSKDGSACPECPFNLLDDEKDPCVNQLFCKSADLIEALAAELEQVEHKLTELLYYVTGGRFSKIEYSTDDMRRFAEDYFQSVCEECPELEDVKRERDAAIEDLAGVCRKRNVCDGCKNDDAAYIPNDCMDCANACNWQWRGVKEG